MLALPLAVSLYTFSSGAWLLPDDAAWLAVLGILIIALGPTRRAWLFGGVVLLALVLVRQNQIWAIAPLMASAWIGDEVTESRSLRVSLLARPWPRIRRSLAVFAAALPAVSALVAFVLLWDGFVPPVGEVNAGGNPAMPVLVLALAGVFGTLFGGYLWWYGAVFRDGRRSGLVGVAATFGVLLSALPETTYDMEAGRWTGLWEVAGRLPTVGDHSLLMVALAGLGAAWISAWALTLAPRDALVWLVAWLGFTAASSASADAWQRYVEPFVLIMFALAASRLRRAPAKKVPRAALAGLVLLSLLLLAVTFTRLLNGGL